MNAPPATALTIAGSDPSGGAGLQMDLKAFEQMGVYGSAVVTLLTVQNTRGVEKVEIMACDLVLEQLGAVLDDIPPAAIKTGALGNPANMAAIAHRLATLETPLVVDPVLVSKHGDLLASDDSVEAYRRHLLPRATLITPNRFEAERLLGRSISVEDGPSLCRAAEELVALGPDFVLLKAGKVGEHRLHAFADTHSVNLLRSPNHPTDNNHGAGCALSALITAHLARRDSREPLIDSMRTAIDRSIESVQRAIASAPGLGQGCGPINTRVLRD